MEPGKYLIFIAKNSETSLSDAVASLPPSIKDNPHNEFMFFESKTGISDTSTLADFDSIRTNDGVINVLRSPNISELGSYQKIAFRYAIEQGFRRIIMVSINTSISSDSLNHFIDECTKHDCPDVVLGSQHMGRASWKKKPIFAGLRRHRILSHLQRKMLSCSLVDFYPSYCSFSTRFLKDIPFERNSNDFLFNIELLIQCTATNTPILEVPIAQRSNTKDLPTYFLKNFWRTFSTCLHYRLQKMGFLYDRKFDLGYHDYPLKDSPYSSHSRLAKIIPPETYVLDLGCGKGLFAQKLIEKQCHVDGSDNLAPDKITAPLEHYKQIDLNGDLVPTEELIQQRQYDYIVLADILEHLVEPERLLDHIRTNYSVHKTPKLLVSTGNVGFFIVRFMLTIGQFNYGPRGILDRTHTYLFTKRSFRRLFEQCGYRVLKIHPIPMPFAAIFPRHKKLALFFESINQFFAHLFPGLFSYQLLMIAEPKPTTNQVLKQHHNKFSQPILQT